jgi:hypothetical protein
MYNAANLYWREKQSTKIVNFCPKRPRTVAFSRIDLLFCGGAVTLLLALAVPGLALSGSRTDRLGCVDNLRQIGLAASFWALEHQDQNPWTLPVSAGGTRPASVTKPGNAWFEFLAYSNELVSPRVLVCPADSRRVPAQASNWGDSSAGGYGNSKFRNNATSYTIGLHSGIEAPQSTVSSDRNLRADAVGQSCSFGINGGAVVIYPAFAQSLVAWTNDVHGLAGNLLLNDGSVLQTTTPALKAYLNARPVDNSPSFHMLIP